MSEFSEVPVPPPIPEQPKVQNHTPIDPEKRKFLKWLGGGATAAAVGSLIPHSPARAEAPQPTSTPESAEVLKNPEGGLVLDFFDVDYIDTLIDSHLKAKGSSFEQLKEEIGLEGDFTLESLKALNPANEEQETFVLMMMLKERYREHGKMVGEIEKKVSDLLGIPDSLYEESEKQDVTPALEMRQFSKDTIGNPTLDLFLSDEYIEKHIAESDARDIGMSLEMGDFSITYEMYKEEMAYPELAMNPPDIRPVQEKNENGEPEMVDHYYHNNQEIEKDEYDDLMSKSKERKSVLLAPTDRQFIINDGYYPEKAYGNLTRMAELAKKFPDKNFYVAGGNPHTQIKRPDIREARKRIEEENGGMPSNLRIVGVKGNYPAPYAASLGCDTYIDERDLEKLELPSMSSFATPMVKKIGGILSDKGMSNKDLSIFFNLISNRPDTSDGAIDVLSIDKVKQTLLLSMLGQAKS